MEMPEFISSARDTMTARRVFADPYEKDGVTVIPAAKIAGGGGGGTGGDAEHGQGMGGGFGLTATPIGAYVIKEGKVTWLPAVDVNRVIMGGQIFAIAVLLTVSGFLRRRQRARMFERFGARRFGAAQRLKRG